jgi:glycosyltransferase involved in cell wall biosynthesis
VIEISIVVPVYRSENCLEALERAISAAMLDAQLGYELILVDDGSPDGSWQCIQSLAKANPNVKGLSHRRNFGQDNAILTGLRVASGPALVIMDDDLQHSPDDIPKLYAELVRSRADVVYAHFINKRHRTWKKLGSWFNGKVAEWLIDKPRNIYLSPFKIISREVADLVTAFDGPYPYLDGLLFQVTNRFSFIEVEHRERFAGESNYTFGKSLHVWRRLAYSYSAKPLTLVTILGVFAFIFGSLGAVATVAYRLFAPNQFSGSAAGWASLMTAFLALAGLQLFALGILGEYVGRTYISINRRPQSIVSDTVSVNTKTIDKGPGLTKSSHERRGVP